MVRQMSVMAEKYILLDLYCPLLFVIVINHFTESRASNGLNRPSTITILVSSVELDVMNGRRRSLFIVRGSCEEKAFCLLEG